MRKDNILGDVLVLIVSIILTIAVSFYSAFVFMQLFNWFLSPIFNYQLAYWGAYGVALLIKMCTIKFETNKKVDDDGIATVIAITIVQVIFLSAFLGIGAWVSLGV